MAAPSRFPLPAEIILAIAGSVGSLRDLSVLARTCRQTHELLTHELYRAAMSDASGHGGEPRAPSRRIRCLMAATSRGHPAAAPLLDMCPTEGLPELYLAAVKERHLGLATLLLDRGVAAHTHHEPGVGHGSECSVAASVASEPLLRLLAARGADVSLCCRMDEHAECAPLFRAALTLDAANVGLLLELGACVDAIVYRYHGVSETLLTYLMAAICHGTCLQHRRLCICRKYIPIIELVVAAGADMVGCGALHIAAQKAKFKVLTIMVRAGADVSVTYKGRTALEYFHDHEWDEVDYYEWHLISNMLSPRPKI